MTNCLRSDLNLINIWLQPDANAYRTRMSCFQQLPDARLPKLKPFKRLNSWIRQYTGLKAGVNEIEGFTGKHNS
jgi:hypothetical protein